MHNPPLDFLGGTVKRRPNLTPPPDPISGQVSITLAFKRPAGGDTTTPHRSITYNTTTFHLSGKMSALASKSQSLKIFEKLKTKQANRVSLLPMLDAPHANLS